MIGFLNITILFSIGYIGLHLPRAFMLLYCFSVSIIALFLLHYKAADRCSYAWLPRRLSLHVVLLSLFSATYVAGMFFWRFWVLPTNALDAVNALILPPLLFVVGVLGCSLGRLWASRSLLVYALGGLVYVLAALAISRDPWWDLWHIFDMVINVPWGSAGVFNVRSVEQNAYPALLLAPVACLFMGKCRNAKQFQILLGLIACSLLGAHAVASLNGRLGWLALFIASVPVVAQCISGLVKRRRIRLWIIPAAAIAVGFSAILLWGFQRVQHIDIWSQGICDERIGYHIGLLTRVQDAPWGGRFLRIPYHFCGEQLPRGLLAQSGGTVDMAHNVFLDILFSVGVLPSLLLLIAILPPVVLVLRTFFAMMLRWDWHVALRWGWLCLLVCQWLFQPLLYSDGLLYYLSFFVLGLLWAEATGAFCFTCGGDLTANRMGCRA